MLECRTFRWRGHVGPRSDMDVGVKRKDELHIWLPRCPILRMKNRLLELDVGENDLAAIDEALRKKLAEAEDFARKSPLPDEGELLDHVFHGNGEMTG